MTGVHHSSSASRLEHSPLGEEGGPTFECGSFRTSFLFPPASRQGAPSPRDRDKQKETAVPVAKLIDSVQGRYIYWGAASYGLMRPLAGLGSMSIKNARFCFGRLSSSFERYRSMSLAMAKVRKNPETSKRFRDFLSFCNEFLSILYINAIWIFDFQALKVVLCGRAILI